MRVPDRKRTRYTWRWAAALGTLAVLAAGLVMWLAVTPSPDVHAANYTVDSTGDASDAVLDGDCDDGTGDCTLRAAIEEANDSSGVPDSISFNIFGAGPHTITLGSALPDIVDDFLEIDGGAETIIIKTGGAFDALVIDADNVTIRDLLLDGENTGTTGIRVLTTRDEATIDPVEIFDFAGDGIVLETNADDNVIDAADIHDNAGTGVAVFTDSDDNTIQDSNIEDNENDGISLADGSGNEITGNTIEDNGDAGGDDGISAANQADLLISNNTISDNYDNQILITGGSTGVINIKNNLIDVDSDGIDLDSTCECGDVKISGSSDAEANTFSGPLGTDEFYLENQSGETVDATNNDWAGDATPTDKICGTNGADPVTDPCDESPTAGSDVEWDPVAPTGSGGVATPTPTATSTPLTPTNTPTVTGTPPTSTATPTVTGTPPTSTPTSTPTTGPQEAVTLVTGCNFVTWTGDDDTSPETLADAVTGTLRGLWAQQPAPLWKGYNPLYPDASDMSAVDHVDVVAICMDSSGTFTRPLI